MAVTSTAFAQNVTISGRIDIGSASTKTTGSKDSIKTDSSTLAGAHGTKTGSRITFAGTEDLGGGLTAFFNTETALNGGAMSARNLFVGVRGGFGSVQAGRYLNSFSPIRDGHYSIAGGAGGGFLNQHLGLTQSTGNTLSNFQGSTYAQSFAFSGDSATSSVVATPSHGGTWVPFHVQKSDGTWQSVAASSTSPTGYIYNGATATRVTEAELRTLNTAGGAAAAVVARNQSHAAQLNSLMNAYGNRSNNALAYTTPKFGDFTLTVGIVNDKITSDRPGRTGQNQAKANAQSYSLAYAGGPLAARLTIGSGKVTQSAETVEATNTNNRDGGFGESRAKTNDTALMVSYDFGVAQAHVMYNETESKLSMFRGVAANAKRETEAYEIGVKMPMGAYEPFVTIGRGDVKTSNAGVSNTATDIKTSAYQLGLNYNLSKRTQVYVSTGEMKAKTTTNTDKTTGYTFGLVHNF